VGGSVTCHYPAAAPPTASGAAAETLLAAVSLAWASLVAISLAFWRITSARRGICPNPRTRSTRYAQKLTPSFRHVFFSVAKVSRRRLPASLRVLPDIFRVFT